MSKQKVSIVKKKLGPSLGFRTSDHFKGRIFSGRTNMPKFDPGRFKTQHKG